MPWTLSTLEKTTARCVQLSRESFQNRPLTKANMAQVCRTDPGGPSNMLTYRCPDAFVLHNKPFHSALNWCCVVNLLQLPDGERLICWVTQIYTVPMERLCSFNEFIYGNDARLQLEYGISGHSAVNNLPLHKHGPSKSKTLFNIQKPVSYIFIDVVWTCVIRLWCSTRLLVEHDICEMSLWGMINSESFFRHSLLRFHGYIWKLLNQQLTESIWMKE